MIDLRKCHLNRFSPKLIKEGTKVEMEHTNNPIIARRVSLQHLCENPNYYKILRRAGL